MKKITLKPLMIALLTLAISISCDDDDLSQEDIINNQQLINLTIRVVDATREDLPIDSAIVEIVDNGEIKSVVTGQTGLAVFTDVTISNIIPVTITKSGYTSVASDINTAFKNYREAHILDKMSLYPIDGDYVTTIKGRLTIESDVTNRKREAVPAGTIVKAFNNNISSSMAFTGETDNEGNYELKVPVGHDGEDIITLSYSEVYVNQKIAVEGSNYTINVVDRPTYFSLAENSARYNIKSLPSVYATIEAPQAATIGEGFALGAEVTPGPIYYYADEPLIVSGGEGYPDGEHFVKLSEGINGIADELEIYVEGGRVIDASFKYLGGWHVAKPEILWSSLSGEGTGAEIEILFMPRYNIFIANHGSNYVTFPEVSIVTSFYDEYYEIRTETIVLDAESASELVFLSGGKFFNKDIEMGDTLANVALVKEPVFEIINTKTERVYLSFDKNDINAEGKIIDMNIEAIGFGYNSASPPLVTLNSVAGFGADASIKFDMNSRGNVVEAIITSGGHGYVKNVNDFRGNGTVYDSNENPGFSSGDTYDEFRTIYNAKPGATIVRSAHYGTGTPKDSDFYDGYLNDDEPHL